MMMPSFFYFMGSPLSPLFISPPSSNRYLLQFTNPPSLPFLLILIIYYFIFGLLNIPLLNINLLLLPPKIFIPRLHIHGFSRRSISICSTIYRPFFWFTPFPQLVFPPPTTFTLPPCKFLISITILPGDLLCYGWFPLPFDHIISIFVLFDLTFCWSIVFHIFLYTKILRSVYKSNMIHWYLSACTRCFLLNVSINNFLNTNTTSIENYWELWIWYSL